ncbi:MAG: HemK2/MTQ2 family protein methyltransferase [Candidatus Altiarchaeota archaeon]
MAVHYKKLVLETSDEVYHPAEDSFLLADSVKAGWGRVLDVGTGTGIQALNAARYAEHAAGVDLNPAAVELAKRNAKANGIRNAEFWVSDLFSEVNGRFDLIVFNPPYLETEAENMLERAWAGGKLGVEVINRFIDEAGGHLLPEGRIMLLISSINRLEEVMKRFEKNGYNAEIAARQKIFFEELYVLTAWRKRRTSAQGILQPAGIWEKPTNP